MSLSRVLGVLAVAIVVAAVVVNLPDIRRYVRISTM
jgi:hypothetical protein